MKIECTIKRQGGTVVDIPNGKDKPDTRYHFKPLDPTQPNSPHVAEVQSAHVKHFFKADADVYQAFEGKPAPDLGPPQSEAERQAEAYRAAAAAAAAAAAQEAEKDKTADDDADTNNDGKISVQELATAIEAGKYTQEQLRELLAAEEATGAPRKGFVRVITAALK